MDWIRVRLERIVNYPFTASHPLAALRRGSKTLEKLHRVVRRTGAIVKVACGISANPHCSDQRFCCVSEVGLCRIGISSGLVSNAAGSTTDMTDIELCQRGAGAGCHGPARGGDPADPNSGIIPVDRVAPGRRNVGARQGVRGLPRLQATPSLARRQSAAGWVRSAPDAKIAGLQTDPRQTSPDA